MAARPNCTATASASNCVPRQRDISETTSAIARSSGVLSFRVAISARGMRSAAGLADAAGTPGNVEEGRLPIVTKLNPSYSDHQRTTTFHDHGLQRVLVGLSRDFDRSEESGKAHVVDRRIFLRTLDPENRLRADVPGQLEP